MRGALAVRVAQPASGALRKRQATLQLCFRPSGVQPKPAIIFRGQGRVKDEEKRQWDRRVDVYFQQNAWLDDRVAIEWTTRTLANAVADFDEEFMLFCDNLVSQISADFKQRVRKLKGYVINYPSGCSDLVQPVDAGATEVCSRHPSEAI